jgi:nitrate reductase molybdenum cofactor assembly chaperone NarJ/NarW
VLQMRPQIYQLLSALLEYPGPDLVESARECAGLLALEAPQAAAQIERFLALAEEIPPGRLEELYTGTFDINPTCTIYAGYQLFGESYKRGEFLVRLKQEYRERGFCEGNELADHLSVLLRFMGRLDPEETLARELIEDCLVPALQKINGSFPEPSAETLNPYACVLRALACVIEHGLPARIA